MSAPTVELGSISKSYYQAGADVHALSSLSLSFAPAKMYAVAGPSGSGKSTLLKLIGLIEHQTRGDLSMLGSYFNQSTPEGKMIEARRNSIGFIFQHFELLSYLTALDNVIMPLQLKGYSYAEAKRRALESLAAVGIADKAQVLPEYLSGGQMQRVAVARAVVHHPPIILADEPTGNLDAESGKAVIDLLQKAASDGATVIIATHSTELMQRCDTVVRLRNGRLEESALVPPQPEDAKGI